MIRPTTQTVIQTKLNFLAKVEHVQKTLTAHHWHTRKNMSYDTPLSVFLILYAFLQTLMVDLFMRWGSILSLGLSLRWVSYSLSVLTAFVVFINITFWHPSRHTLWDRFQQKLLGSFIPTLTGRQQLFLLIRWQIWNFLLQYILDRPSWSTCAQGLQCHLCFIVSVSWELKWFGEGLPQGWIYSVLVQ